MQRRAFIAVIALVGCCAWATHARAESDDPLPPRNLTPSDTSELLKVVARLNNLPNANFVTSSPSLRTAVNNTALELGAAGIAVNGKQVSGYRAAALLDFALNYKPPAMRGGQLHGTSIGQATTDFLNNNQSAGIGQLRGVGPNGTGPNSPILSSLWGQTSNNLALVTGIRLDFKARTLSVAMVPNTAQYSRYLAGRNVQPSLTEISLTAPARAALSGLIQHHREAAIQAAAAKKSHGFVITTH